MRTGTSLFKLSIGRLCMMFDCIGGRHGSYASVEDDTVRAVDAADVPTTENLTLAAQKKTSPHKMRLRRRFGGCGCAMGEIISGEGLRWGILGPEDGRGRDRNSRIRPRLHGRPGPLQRHKRQVQVVGICIVALHSDSVIRVPSTQPHGAVMRLRSEPRAAGVYLSTAPSPP